MMAFCREIPPTNRQDGDRTKETEHSTDAVFPCLWAKGWGNMRGKTGYDVRYDAGPLPLST